MFITDYTALTCFTNNLPINCNFAELWYWDILLENTLKKQTLRSLTSSHAGPPPQAEILFRPPQFVPEFFVIQVITGGWYFHIVMQERSFWSECMKTQKINSNAYWLNHQITYIVFVSCASKKPAYLVAILFSKLR